MPVVELPGGTLLRPDDKQQFRYEILSTLGAGGFGITYRAFDRQLHGQVVIKELAWEGTAFRETGTHTVQAHRGKESEQITLQRRFVEEARRLNRVRSRNVVRVIDVWEERGTAYYAMDEVREPRALPIVRTAAPLSQADWERIRGWADQLLDALEHVHGAGLIHGDIKPQNVLLDGSGAVVLIDFGTARTDVELNRTVTWIGYTLGYAPPELMPPPSLHRAGPWSDLYSWAMVVYGLVRPHAGPSGLPSDALRRLQGDDPYRNAGAALVELGVPRPWATAIERCLRMEPEERPRSVGDLREIAGSDAPPTLVEKPSPPTQETPPASTTLDEPNRALPLWRRLLLVASLALGIGALLLMAGLVALFHYRDTPLEAVARDALAERRLPTREDIVRRTRPTVRSAPATSQPTRPAIPTANAPAQPPRPAPLGAPCTPEPGCREGNCIDGHCAPRGFRYVPAGSFLAGSPTNEFARGEQEVAHQVVVTRPYFIGLHEVTQLEWSETMGYSPSAFPSTDGTAPVERVNWFEAIAFANARSQAEGLETCYRATACSGTDDIGCGGTTSSPVTECEGGYRCQLVGFSGLGCDGYRLPTEAEWEYAARSGVPSASPLGDVIVTQCSPSDPVLGGVGWFCGNSGARTHPVGSLRPNAWGVYDMLGNVREWAWDWQAEYPLGQITDPLGPDTGTIRTARGGGWPDAPTALRHAARGGHSPVVRRADLGFRLVRTARAE